LRKRAADLTGVEQPVLARLRRITVGTVVQLGLLVLAAAAIIAAAGNVDFDELQKDLEDAAWGWALAGLLTVQTTRLLQAASTRATVPARLAFGPIYAMQLAIGFMNVALPSAVARMAVNIRFFQRQGVSPPVAVTAGAIDSFAGNVVQILLLVLLLIFTPYSVDIGLDQPSGDSGGHTLLTILLILLVVSIGALLIVPRLRNAMLQRLRRWWPEIRAAVGSLTGSSKLLVIVFALTGAELVFAGSLGLFARSLGYELPLAQLLVINLSVSLFASLIPVPGGIGVTEGAMMVGLASAGLPDSTALAVTLLYRVSTFYLPPVWGWLAMRWLQRHQYL
jgi:glycosyltransferase 2 family protein